MGHFHAAGKRYADGSDFPAYGPVDVGVTAAPTPVDLTAPATLPDGTGSRPFLFWDTGRRLTGKRRVVWTFNHPDQWTTWNATAWYGPAGPGKGGEPVYGVNALWVGTGTMDPSPVDGPGSTFVNGPNAADVAWPWGGDTHAVRTQWGAATVRALGNLRRTPADPQLEFSSLMQLVVGGDNDGFFAENDDGVTTSSGVTGIASTTAQQLTLPQGSGGLLLAGYVLPAKQKLRPPGDVLVAIDEEIFRRFFDRGDPSPDDLVRIRKILHELLDARGPDPATKDAFKGLVTSAKLMNAVQLKRSIAETKAILKRGEAAVKSMEAIAARKAPR